VSIGVLVALLAGLGGLYAQRVAALPMGWTQARADPAAHDGALLVFSLYQVSDLGPPPRIGKVVRDVPLVGQLPTLEELEVGDTVSVVGRFRAADEVVVVSRLEVHRWRWAKQVLSSVGLLGLFLWAVVRLRWRDGGLRVGRTDG